MNIKKVKKMTVVELSRRSRFFRTESVSDRREALLTPFMPAVDLRSLNRNLTRFGQSSLDRRFTFRDDGKVKIFYGHWSLSVTITNVLG